MKKMSFRSAMALGIAAALCFLCACSLPFGSKWKEDKPYESYNLSEYVKLGAYKGVEIVFEPEEEADVTDEMLRMDAMRYCISNGASLLKLDTNKTTAANGDIITLDFEGSGSGLSAEALEGLKAEGVELEIGGGGFIPDLEEQLIGRKSNVPFDASVTFPEEYPQSPDLAGKEVSFHCTIKKIATMVLSDSNVVKNGDIVIFDFEGTAPGLSEEVLQNMKANGFQLLIGSGMFISGFEEQVVGQTIGEPFDVDVTFPENYQEPELMGKDVTFHCTVNKIGVVDFKDETMNGASGGEYPTLEDYYAFSKTEFVRQAKDKNQQEALTAAYQNAEILKFPDREMKYYEDLLAKEAEAYEQTLDDFYSSYPEGKEGYQKQMNDQIRRELFIFAVAEKEGLQVTEADLKDYLDERRAGDESMKDEDIYEQTQGGKGMLLRGLTMQKVMEFIYENAKAQ